MKKLWLLSDPFYPLPSEYKLGKTLDLVRSRDNFLAKRPSNLDYLLQSRYDWMNAYLGPEFQGIELGSGIGVSHLYIENNNLVLTDVIANPWIDQVVDALQMPYLDSSMNYIIAMNVIHHISNAVNFFDECSRVLKPKGVLLIQEPHLSLIFRLLLRLMAHEGYDYNADVFDPQAILNNPNNPWTANNAISDLLFDDAHRFEKNVPFKILKQEFVECFIFPLSGGVSYRTKTINLPKFALKMIHFVDNILVKVAPSIFAMGCRVVLVNGKTE